MALRFPNVSIGSRSPSPALAGAIATTLLVAMFTRRIDLAIAVGGIDFLLKHALRHTPGNREEGSFRARPAVIWLTGLSGAGKTTIAREVTRRLIARGEKVEHLDGDTVRDIFPRTGFSRADRDDHIRRVGYLASRLEKHGVTVVASFISPFEDSRAFVRGLCESFHEVHVATPLDECERRDVKGLYAKARSGEITRFTGIDDPYEEPVRPELRIDTRFLSVDESARLILDRVRGPE